MITPVAYLKAHDPERNIHRAYSIAYGQDLSGMDRGNDLRAARRRL